MRLLLGLPRDVAPGLRMRPLRLANVVTHPIQIPAPLYSLLASSDRFPPIGCQHRFVKNQSIRLGIGPWGLVVNVASAAGCERVGSNTMRCRPDLLTTDRTFRTKYPDELAVIFDPLYSDTDGMAAARRHGASVIDRFSLMSTAEGIEGGIETAMEASGR